jgi:hypothetical protein
VRVDDRALSPLQHATDPGHRDLRRGEHRARAVDERRGAPDQRCGGDDQVVGVVSRLLDPQHRRVGPVEQHVHPVQRPLDARDERDGPARGPSERGDRGRQVVSGVEQVAGADQRQAHLEDANPGPSQ